MIVQIRGTGGAGKSEIARVVMARCTPGGQSAVKVEGRRQPIGYELYPMSNAARLFVPGHYETACGGCDTIKTTDQVYDLVWKYHQKGFNVLHEGIMISDDTRRAVELDRMIKKEYSPNELAWMTDRFVVIHLDPPIELCLAGIQARRDARGDTDKLNPKNTVERVKRIKRHCVRLRDAGVRVLKFTDREEAKTKVLELLGFGTEA